MDKYDIIINAEQQFAREVALGVIYLRSPSVWHYVIPGMFIIDFLRRGSIIRKYTESDNTKASMAPSRETEIKSWLTALKLDSQDLVMAQTETVDLLIEHYVKLLQAEGERYYDLIQNAYSSRENFEAHLRQITAAENKVDRAILARVGDNPAVKEKLELEARQVENRRQKILEDIF
jgi:hypothetical protein